MRRLRGVGQGSDEFAAFVQETGTQLYRAALLLTGEHHAAEDLTQATYAKLFASWRKVRRADSALAYARTTLLHTFVSQRRRRSSTEQPVAEFAETPGRYDDPDTRLDLLAALGQLSALDRAVILTRYWDDHSVADTAAALGMTESAVRTRARRALQRLRPHLAQPITGGTHD